MVFIRPTIIRNAADGDRMTQRRYGYMRDQQLAQNPGVEPSLDALVRDYMGAVPPIPPGTPETGTVIRPQQVMTVPGGAPATRSEEHTSELQSLMRISYAVFCLKKKNKQTTIH